MDSKIPSIVSKGRVYRIDSATGVGNNSFYEPFLQATFYNKTANGVEIIIQVDGTNITIEPGTQLTFNCSTGGQNMSEILINFPDKATNRDANMQVIWTAYVNAKLNRR